MLSGISVVCFGASYAVALLLEISRLFVRGKVRNAVMIGFTAAGLLAHTVFLGYELRQRAAENQPLLTWFTACLIFAWILIVAHLVALSLRRNSTTGLLLLPTSLVLIVVGQLFPSSTRAVQAWNLLHIVSLLIGMGLVAIGFTTGLMYLIQSYRLKHKLPPRSTFWFPSLERLQSLNERCLLTSVLMLGIGLISGILLNLVRSGSGDLIPWTDPVVVASLIWLVWLLAVALFHAFYRPARQGRKVAYMTIGSFMFLGAVLGVIWWLPSHHSTERSTAQRAAADQSKLPPGDDQGAGAQRAAVGGDLLVFGVEPPRGPRR